MTGDECWVMDDEGDGGRNSRTRKRRGKEGGVWWEEAGGMKRNAVGREGETHD